MKKILIVVLVVVLVGVGVFLISQLTSREQQPNTIKIASWNINYGLGLPKQFRDTFIENLASVISRFDIVALQEIPELWNDSMPPEALLRLLDELNKKSPNPSVKWRYVMTPRPVGGGPSPSDHLAFVYRDDRGSSYPSESKEPAPKQSNQS